MPRVRLSNIPLLAFRIHSWHQDHLVHSTHHSLDLHAQSLHPTPKVPLSGHSPPRPVHRALSQAQIPHRLGGRIIGLLHLRDIGQRA